MLKYLVAGTESLVVAGVLLGMLFACMEKQFGQRGFRAMCIGSLLGFLAAAVMSYMKNKTKLIDTGMWNVRIFSAFIALLVLFLIADLKPVRKRLPKASGILCPFAASAMGFLLIFYCLPDVLGYPYNFVLGGESVLSTGFLYRLIGLCLGVLLVLVTLFAVRFVGLKADEGLLSVLLKTGLLINGAQWITKILQTLLTRRKISGHTIFQIVKFTSNHASLFIALVLLTALVLPLVLLWRSLRVNEPYENPAEHRKIRANWRSIRRWSSAVLVCFLLSAVNITAVKAYVNRPVELSPSEPCEVRGDNVYVSFDQVEDGHLHRFTYTTPKGVGVRFIVIKKPNSSAFGIGLDACDICGETGYFERNGQIVCKLCDVVMNVNTIGFKGGCNPKVIDYSVENGYIVVPTATLVEHEGDFKKK